jgi:hypothetical protein
VNLTNNNNKSGIYNRTSIITWLKNKLRSEEEFNYTTISASKYWTAIGGAINVEDCGLVIVCPKVNTNTIYRSAIGDPNFVCTIVA